MGFEDSRGLDRTGAWVTCHKDHRVLLLRAGVAEIPLLQLIVKHATFRIMCLTPLNSGIAF